MLEQCKKNIKVYEEFWKTFADVMKNEEHWMQTPVNELDADEIQSSFKKLSAVINRMEITFDGMRLKKQAKFAG